MTQHGQINQFLPTAQYLIYIGLCPVLLSGKKPIFSTYTEYLPGPAGKHELTLPPDRRPLRYSESLLRAWASEYPRANIGILTRERPSIDIDAPHIWDAIGDLVPPTPHAKRGARGFTLIYSRHPTDPVRRTRTFVDPFKRAMLLEVLADGRQTVLPPSIHPDSGQPYQWIATSEFMSRWGFMVPVPLNHITPPPLSQAVVDAIEARLAELGLTKHRVERGTGLARSITDGERRRYEAFMAPKLRERLVAVREAVRGHRQDALNGAVYALAPWVREGFLAEDDLEGEMREACLRNGYIIEDGDKAFTRQFGKSLDEGWATELPDLDAGRAAALMGNAPLALTYLPSLAVPVVEAGGGGSEFWVYDGTLPPEEPELIRRLLPAVAGNIAFIAGKSGMGKSFYAAAMCVALGIGPGVSFFGHPVRERVGTIIIAAEGAGGMKARLYAAAQAAGARDRLPIVVIPRCGNLCTEGARGAMSVTLRAAAAHLLAEYGVRVGAVILDTMLAAFGMEDEGASAEAQKICGYMREMGESVGAVIVPIHHIGKDGAQGMRGSSAFYAAADHVVICGGDHDHETGETQNRYLAVDKSRNDSTGLISNADLTIVDLGIDQYGDRRTTCVYAVREGVVDPKSHKKDQSHGLHAVSFDQAYDACVARNQRDGVPSVELSLAFKLVCHSASQASKRQAWKRTQERMLIIKRYRCNQDVWFRET